MSNAVLYEVIGEIGKNPLCSKGFLTLAGSRKVRALDCGSRGPTFEPGGGTIPPVETSANKAHTSSSRTAAGRAGFQSPASKHFAES